MAASDAFYQDIVVEVDSVIDELGTSYTVRSPGTYEEATLATSIGGTRSVSGLVADKKTTLNLTAGDGPTWVAEKTLILKAAASPAPGEEILVDGDWFPLSKVVPIKPADVTVVYMLDVTR